MEIETAAGCAAWRTWNRHRWEALDAFRAQEQAGLTDEPSEQIIRTLVAVEPWRERPGWSLLVVQQALFRRRSAPN